MSNRNDPLGASQALNLALEFHREFGAMMYERGVDRGESVARVEEAVLETAEVFLAWLNGPKTITVTVTETRPQGVSVTSTDPRRAEVQLQAGWEFDVTVNTADARGFRTSDQIDYENSDDSVVEVIGATDDDSHTATIRGLAPGESMVTLTDNAVDPPLTAAVAVVVTAGPTTEMNIVEGEARETTPA